MLVGSPDRYHPGINPTHELRLSENHRPAWILSPLGGDQADRTVWIPTVEDMLEDGLLMAGLLAIGDARLREQASRAFRKPFTEQVEMYDDLDEVQRRELYAACREIGSDNMVALCVLEGSTLAGQIGVLADYGVEVEVCCPIFKRGTSTWQGGTQVAGALQMPALDRADRA
jgi:hypothetical protein